MTGIPQDHARELFFAALAGGVPSDQLIELRQLDAVTRAPRRSLFVAAAAPRRASTAAARLAASREVYAGAQPRTRHDGSAGAVPAGHVLFVDLDDPAAALGWQPRTPVAPTFVIRSGSVTDGVPHLLLLWALHEPLAARWLPKALKRLAHHMGGDPKSTDVARVIRIPGTVNYKHGERRPVECIHVDIAAVYTPAEVVAGLPDPIEQRPAPARVVGAPGGPARDITDDPLFSIPASEYIPVLTGRELCRDGKVQCPWHGGGQERTPSLHAYTDPARGWQCYGCDVGGSIIDFGARLWGITPRGAGYHEVRRRLAVVLHSRAMDLVA